MSEKNKSGYDHLSDFLRYKGNKMTESERNAFERNLEKDSFAREASEGLEGIDSSLAYKDVTGFRKKIKKRTARKHRVLRYRIAASVAMLMIISSIFIIIEKREPSEQLSYAPNIEQPKDLQTSNDQPSADAKAPAAEPAVKNQPVASGPEKSIKSPGKTNETESKSDKIHEIKKEDISAEPKEQIRVAEATEPDQILAAEKAMPAKAAEIVVVGYGARGDGYKAEEVATQYNQPRPVGGRADFEKYIRDNIRRPDTTSAGQSVVVVVDLVVSAEGRIDSIKIIKSPGKIFSEEAIRLIREGPEWKPAEENGKTINDNVRIRIVFK